MPGEKNNRDEPDKTRAAVCGLYCEACSWFIAATEEPERLKKLAARVSWSEEESRCYGCRSGKRLPYCAQCKMFACAAQRGIDFCSECDDYPCDDLMQFQAAMPHRIELWDNLQRIKSAGYQQWLREVRGKYACPGCGALNSAYDLKCRRCGEEPSCRYVAQHRQDIEEYLKKW
ncbi:MAG TPA: DUF3795 domain-containing protein [Candidatus Omnitrophota bacterium]|nr:DUF3795 domain-containing protein [Candidatus Omnitrophota bacterium]HQO58225.1 DUF3795 domain-containing protein [Candidatus Omnitrophota bacterium]